MNQLTANHPFGTVLRQSALLFLLATLPLPTVWADEDGKGKETEDATQNEAVIKAQFEYSFNDVSGTLVIIESRAGMARMAGSGFIAKMDGKTYIFTNQHVIMGADSIEFKTVTGERLKPRGVELSLKRDIARLLIEDKEAALVISDNLAMGIPLAVFGNSEGGGVATELYGTVTGVGADLVEVSAEFVSGNSGSPVLTLDKEVIGIASYVRYSQPSKMKEGTRFENKVRRFCYRLTDVRWMPVNWGYYNRKYGKPYLETSHTIDSLGGIIGGWYEDPFARVPTGDQPDMSLHRWAATHNKMVERVADIKRKGFVSRSQLNKIRDEVQGSAHALSVISKRLSMDMEDQSKDPALTGFLRDEFEGYAYGLQYASEVLDYAGKWMADYIDNL